MASNAMTAGSGGVSVGRVLGKAFGVIGANPVVMLGVSFLFAALPNTFIGYAVQGYEVALAGRPDAFRNAIVLGAAAMLIMLVLTFVVQGALVRATIAHAEGRKASFGESVTAGLRVVVPLIALAIVVALAVGIGFLLLIVPGIILYTIWSVASPALVEERTGVFGALRRSAELTRGARWKVFGLNLVVLVAIWVLSAISGSVQFVAGGGGDPLAQATSPAILAVNAVATTLITAFWAASQTALFVELREWKDGPRTARLSEVFA